MSELTINDFRSAMGKFNLGSLQLEGEGDNQKIKLVNNHNKLRSFRNVTQNPAEGNIAVRTQFAAAIETFLRSRGYDLGADTKVGKFLDAVRQDLLGEDVKTRDLSRSADVARLLDKLDAAVALGDFDLQSRGSVALKDRFFFTAAKGRQAGGTFQLDGQSKADALADQTLATVKGMLTLDDAGNLPNDKQLLKLAMKGAHISDTRATTYLMTRPETILVKADKYLRETLAAMKPGELNGLVGDVGKVNLARLAIAKAVEDIHADTVSAKSLAALSGNRRQAANMMMGLDTFNVARLADKGELNGLMAGLSRLAAGSATDCKVRVLGQEMTLAKNGTGELNVTFGKVRFAAFGDAKVMLRSIENALVNGNLPADALKAVYHNADYMGAGGDTAEGLRRARTVGTAIIRQASGLGDVELQTLSDLNLKRVADAIDGGQLTTAKDIGQRVGELASTRVYSEATLSTVNGYLKASPEVQNTATITEARTDTTPAVNKLVSDLFSNADVWVMDNTDGQIGGRLQQTLLSHADTLVALLAGDVQADSLPAIGDANVAGTLDKLLTLLRENGVTDAASLEGFVANNADKLATLEADIDGMADAAIGKIQTLFAEKMAEDVGDVKADTRELWQKPLGDVIAEQKKSSGSVEGQFINRLMEGYLKRSSTAEKRSMMASLVGLTTAGSDDVQKFSAVLKGAGPVFQKLLQGFPEDQVPAGMRGVFADMKSHLAPIPDTVVKATLAKVVADSNGTIASISLDKTLGSASVGQAFLCTVRRTDGTSQKAVVKMLKPDVQNRFSREVNLLRTIAGEVDAALEGKGGMKETLEGRIATIKDELNFNVESENIKEGQIYNKGGTVKSVELFKGVASDMNVLVMTLAEGDTVDNYIADAVDAKIAQIKGGLTHRAAIGLSTEQYTTTDMGTLLKNRTELLKLAEDIAQKQAYLADLAKSWFDEAVFGKGFFQGDMHAGNILVSDKGVTVIDFGNAKKLTDTEAQCLKKLICSAAAGDVDKYLEGMDKLLEGTEGGAKLKAEDVRTDLKAFLGEIFVKGGLNETDEKLFVAMNALQNRGIEIPSAVYNYTSSQNRLKNTLADMGAKLDEVKDLLARTTLDADVVYDDSAHGGSSKSFIGGITRVANFAPVVSSFTALVTTGFTARNIENLVKLRSSFAPENRPAVVEALMRPGQIDAAVKPALAFFQSIGAADGARGARLADAEAKLLQATTDEARRAALTDIVDVLHEIQLRMVDEAERTRNLPGNKSLGEAVSDVIRSKFTDDKGEISIIKGLQLCGQIGGPGLAQKLRTKLEIEEAREERESILDGGRCECGRNLPGLNMWPENDVAIFKKYAGTFMLSAATKAHLADKTFKFADDPAARTALMRELALNVKAIYLKEVVRGQSPIAKARGDFKIMRANATFAQISTYAKDKADAIRGKASGDLENFAAALAYTFSYQQLIDSPNLFTNLAREMSANTDLRGLLDTEVEKFIVLDNADVDQLVEATFDDQARLRGLDPATLGTTERDALRVEIRDQIRSDFEAEVAAIQDFVLTAVFLTPQITAQEED